MHPSVAIRRRIVQNDDRRFVERVEQFFELPDDKLARNALARHFKDEPISPAEQAE